MFACSFTASALNSLYMVSPSSATKKPTICSDDRGLWKRSTEVMINKKSLMGPARVIISDEVLLTKMNTDRLSEKARKPETNKTNIKDVE
mmetsp:Transcript_30422/g.41871  ORF Transcript_30422/g.41871 Transcript_30422/m.41871 type:complete len:90 (-) Transcript_30422:549-818(-)